MDIFSSKNETTFLIGQGQGKSNDGNTTKLQEQNVTKWVIKRRRRTRQFSVEREEREADFFT